jgi:hypothetical protein
MKRLRNALHQTVGFERDSKSVLKAVSHVEISNDHREFDDLGIRIQAMHLLKNVVACLGRVQGYVLGPQNSRLLTRREMGRVHVDIRMDGLELLIRDTHRPAQGGIVRQSVITAVQEARLDDGHLLDF